MRGGLGPFGTVRNHEFHGQKPLSAEYIANAVPDPLLHADSVRVDDGVPVVENLTIETTGTNVAVVGAARALFEAMCGVRPIVRGTLRICGMDPRVAIRAGAMASAPIDVPVPARWTVHEFARENARLAGQAKSVADKLAKDAVHAMQLDAYAAKKLAGTDVSVKRAAMIAAALATGAGVIVVQDFTAGLPDAAARSLAKLFVAACEGRRWIVFAGRLALSSPIGLHADEALLFAGGRFVCAGLPAEIAARERTYTVRTSGEAEPFAAKLRERGAVVEGIPGGLTVTMPEDLATHELVALARDSNVVVLELLPLSGALA
jgi:ABC-type multidrug transport system ATPase subunit